MTVTEHTQQAGTGARLDFGSHAAAFSRALSALDRAATAELDKADIDHRLRELIRIRASQLNGCAYCIDMHSKDARAVGETEQRIYALPGRHPMAGRRRAPGGSPTGRQRPNRCEPAPWLSNFARICRRDS